MKLTCDGLCLCFRLPPRLVRLILPPSILERLLWLVEIHVLLVVISISVHR